MLSSSGEREKQKTFFNCDFIAAPAIISQIKKNVSYKTIKKNVHLSTFKIPKAVRASHIAVLCRDNDVRSNDIKSRKVNLRSFHFALFFIFVSHVHSPNYMRLGAFNYIDRIIYNSKFFFPLSLRAHILPLKISLASFWCWGYTIF